MNKVIIFGCLMLFIIGIVEVCQAGSIGPIEPLGPMKVSITAEDNDIYKMNLISPGDPTITDIHLKTSNQGYAELALGITEWNNVYMKFGTANLSYWINSDNGRSQVIKYNYGLMWGIGTDAFYEIVDNFGLGADVQFNTWHTNADTITGSKSTTFIQKGSLSVYDFQTAVYLAYNYHLSTDTLTPYVGGYYSRFKVNIDKAIEFQDPNFVYVQDASMKSKDNFGLLAGLSVTATENISLKLEGRFIAENAISFGANYKF